MSDQYEHGAVPLQAELYTRTASRMSAGNGNRLRAQRDACITYLTEQYSVPDLSLTEYTDEGVSGRDTGPQWRQLVKQARLGQVRLLVVASPERISRSTKQFMKKLAELQQYGVEVHSANYGKLTSLDSRTWIINQTAG